MPVLQPKHKSGHQASIVLRWRRHHDALAVHVSGQMADTVQFDGETDLSQYKGPPIDFQEDRE